MKREFLELLDRDVEFRYAVAGYLGLSEILKRLDTLAEEQVKLREEQINLGKEQVNLRKEQTKIWEEIKALREEQVRLREEQVNLREEQTRLREEQTKIWEEIKALREEQTKIWKEIEALREEHIKLREDMIAGFKRHDEEMARLREDFNKMYKQLDARLTRVERTLEKITVDIEDEARIILKYRLRDMGYEVEVNSLILPELEINLYGASNDLCIVGEASVRASSGIIDEINRKIEQLREMHPDKLRPKIIKVVYTSIALPDLVERAKKESIWILKAAGDIIKPNSLPLS